MAIRSSITTMLVLIGFFVHPVAADISASFAGKLRCPFAKVWVEHGPQRAAEMLGFNSGTPGHARRLENALVYGTCTYKSPFAGSEVCMELHGVSWTDATASERCAKASGLVAGSLVKGGRCQTSAETAGWCSTAAGSEMIHTLLSATASTCDAAASACVTWSQGVFVAGGKCAKTHDQTQQHPSMPPSSAGYTWTAGGGGIPFCTIAPGPMGAAHQLAQSPGYAFNCNNTPARQSPWMWPLRWSAHVEAKSLGYKTDEVQYESKGRVWYMLDKNWKRLDTWYEKGVHRAIGQAPCEPENNDTSLKTARGCKRSGMRNTTMLHRGSKMVFIDWADNGTISNCRWLDLGPIGNIRPDWFMDDRGASTAVQYLGDSHVYHMGEPRLVKQWRKKDFANQYFTMSMQANVGEDGTHWPLILNVPGEGFGDDFLQHYHGHQRLEDSHSDAFLLDEQFVASGGTCPQQARSRGTDGPPTGQSEHVPSNLEVEVASWRNIVWTGSPVWTGALGGKGPESTAPAGKVEVADGVHANTCWDSTAGVMRFTMYFDLPTPVWTSIGFRGTEECLMTPRGGGNGEVIFAKPGSGGVYSMFFGPLPPTLKQFNAHSATRQFEQSLTLLSDTEGFEGSSVSYSNGQLVMGFARNYSAKPGGLHLTFAIGIDAKVSYHSKRECFMVSSISECPVFSCSACSSCQEDTTPHLQQKSMVSFSTWAALNTASVLVVLLAGAFRQSA